MGTWLAYLLYALFAYLLNALGASTERLRAELGVSQAVVGLHATAFAAGLVVGGLAGDRLSGRLGRGRAVLAGGAGMAAGVVLLAAGRVAPVTLAGALAMGLSGSLLLIVAPAYLADRHGAGAGAALAMANAVASVLGGLAPFVVGAAVAAALGWRWAFAAGSAALLAVAVGFWRINGEATAASPGPAVEPGGRARSLPPSYWWWWATLVLVVSVEFSFVFWTAEELRAGAGAAPAVAAGSVAVFVLGMAAGRLAGGRLLDRARALTMLRAGLALSVCGFVLFWLARDLRLALPGLAAAGLGVAMLYPLSLAGAISVAPGRSDLATGRAALGSGVAIGCAPFALGWLADGYGVHTAYLVVPFLAAAAWATSLFAVRLAAARS
jgi:MFS family permease